jgi:beta-lactamase regulating signal transducer with metallopeptidase domain
MFAARCIAVSSSVFFLIYVLLSLLVSHVARYIYGYAHKLSPKHCADLLLAVRLFPLLAAGAITAAFTVPSFILLEPRSIAEPLSAIPLSLGLCAIALALFGAGRAVAALTRSSRLIARWTSQANAVNAQTSVPVLRIGRDGPALTAAGILRPRILLSGSAEFVLDQHELRTALRHEVAHVRRRDNLKKLLLLLVTFPGLKLLDTAWGEATEMAADDAAVENANEALDLAQALIKLSRMSAGAESRCPQLMTAFSSGAASLISARVQRLLAWSDQGPAHARHRSHQSASRIMLAITAATTTTAAIALTYSQLLAQVHTATEWLVR